VNDPVNDANKPLSKLQITAALIWVLIFILAIYLDQILYDYQLVRDFYSGYTKGATILIVFAVPILFEAIVKRMWKGCQG
jgi:hypothetical protein